MVAAGPDYLLLTVPLTSSSSTRANAATGRRHIRHRMRKAVSRQPADRVRTIRAASAKCLAPRA